MPARIMQIKQNSFILNDGSFANRLMMIKQPCSVRANETQTSCTIMWQSLVFAKPHCLDSFCCLQNQTNMRHIFTVDFQFSVKNAFLWLLSAKAENVGRFLSMTESLCLFAMKNILYNLFVAARTCYSIVERGIKNIVTNI